MKEKRFNKILIGTGLLLLVAISLTISFFELSTEEYLTTGWVLIVIILLWLGNSFISNRLDAFLPWLKYGTLRFFAQLVFGVSYSLIILNISYYALKLVFTEEPPTIEQLFAANVYGFLIILPAISIYFGIHFLKSWRKSEVAAERLQKESIKSQLDALKDHLDPHFLFNNLNILSSLIDKDKEQSKAYLDRFADVYRFILQNENSELIPLARELEFLESYVYLIKIRFEETIDININIPDQLSKKTIPPLTLQMLLENAIKHNVITELRPLKIDFETDGNYITVSNNLQTKKINGPEVEGSGLKNIKDRYGYFTDKVIFIQKGESHFKVRVPLLEIESI